MRDRDNSIANALELPKSCANPADTRRNNNVIIASKRRRDVVLT